MFSNDRHHMRQVFFDAWQKHLNKRPLEPLEAQIVDIILQHPEYHLLLSDPERFQTKDFDGENPFLHLSLHLALREQLATNRPVGIVGVYERLCFRVGDALEAEHLMMGCLGEVIWQAQRSGRMPEEEVYLDELKKLG